MNSKPIIPKVRPRDDNPQRGYLTIGCEKRCTFSLTDGPARHLPKGGKEWHWDGNVEAPTISPSIDCTDCGRHFTITRGQVG